MRRFLHSTWSNSFYPVSYPVTFPRVINETGGGNAGGPAKPASVKPPGEAGLCPIYLC